MQPGGQPDMQSIIQQAQQMQQQLMEAQEKIAAAVVEGQAGGGLVTAKLTGTGELVDLTIDPKVVDPDDVETLQDLVMGAIKDANTQSQNLAAETLGPFAQGMGGGSGIPGLPF
ncbi:YbaB/EbfC family nucleoid-associated protein [Lolliginicoccus suaedae]|uniref:YbaB/EbfC family nucleoid-associated protein n=1 Tax=Lolliginicoccus suaedae TaxID=2605429 RepID=UPI0011ED4757|nr:YbaB/EbfC family nucleoid-associated protein [Lolliginicoccus suaedae]